MLLLLDWNVLCYKSCPTGVYKIRKIIFRSWYSGQRLRAWQPNWLGGWFFRSRFPGLTDENEELTTVRVLQSSKAVLRIKIWSYRDEPTVNENIAFKGLCLLVHPPLRYLILHHVQLGHREIEAALKVGREHIFWSNM